jgi:hypothetical protein
MTNRPGPAHIGTGRVFLARALLMLTISFLLAGSGLAALMSLGIDPLR